MQGFAQDFLFSLRVIRRRPLSAAIIVAMLALGVGANAAIFSVVNGVLLRPLALPEPDRLVILFEENEPEEMFFQRVAPPKLDDWKAQATSFDQLGALSPTAVNLSGDFDPERLAASEVSEGLLEVIGLAPQLGRPFQPEEYVEGADQVVLLSDSLWRRKFGGAADIVGKTVQLNQQLRQVVGVMPPVQEDLGLGDAVMPFSERIDNREIHFLRVLGRMRDGVSVNEAQTEMDGIAARLAQAYPGTDANWGILVVSLHEQLVGEVATALGVLLGAAGLALLIACVNIVHLLLARTEQRQAELAVRVSLGASRSRIVRQLVTESVVLGAIGAVVALFVGHWSITALLRLAPQGLVRRSVPTLDPVAVAFGLSLSILATVVVALIPALRHSRTLPAARARTTGTGNRFLRQVLVVPEIALAVVLVVGAGLLIRSFDALVSVDPGFRPSGVLTVKVGLSGDQFSGDEEVRSFTAALLERVQALPGVESAEVSNSVPLTGGPWFNIERASLAGDGDLHRGPGPMRVVTPDYLGTVGIDLLAGRDFVSSDDLRAALVIVLDEKLAARLFPGEDPIGSKVRTYYDEIAEREVVGVVRGVKQWGLDAITSAGFYVPLAQVRWSTLYIAVRTAGDPIDAIPAVQRAVWSLAPDIPVDDIRTMDQRLATSVGEPRFQMLLVSLFGFVSLLLASGGIVGVTLNSVAHRRREIGVRMAMGAGGGDVVAMIVRQNMAFVVAGLGCGLALSYFAVRLVESLLFQVDPLDPYTFVAVSVAVLLMAAVASWVPALRAAAVDPMVTIRAD